MQYKFISTPTQPNIIFLEEAYAKMLQIVHSKVPNGKEVMWLGNVQRTENTYVIYDIQIPPQCKNSATYVETDDAKFPEWIGPMKLEERKSIRLHGHLHPNMSPTPSGTDQAFFQNKLKEVSDFFIRIIINEKHEFTLDLFDKQTNLIYNECTYKIMLAENIFIDCLTNGKCYPKVTNDFKLSDMPFEIEGNDVFFKLAENVTLYKSILTNEMSLETKNLVLTNEKLEVYETSELVDAELTMAIAKTTYYGGHTQSNFGIVKGGSYSYDSMLFDDYPRQSYYSTYQENKIKKEREEQILKEALGVTNES